MRLNFKRISALVASALMLGTTAGIASAANYPAPFVTNGTANVAVVYGSGAALSDSTAAGSIATSLSSFVSGGDNVSVSGEAVPLDRGTASKIWLNTSLTNAQSVFTASDLPNTLATSTFSGSTSTTVTPQITMMSAVTAGGDNTNTVEFSKQPTASVDPLIGVSIGATASNALYNATVVFGTAEAFNTTASQGPALHLFGRDYVVSSATTGGASGQLVLFQSAQTLTLSQGGTSGSSTATATVNGVSHTVQLINAGTTSATISVDGTTQSVTVGSSVTINGVSIAVTSVQSSTAGGNTATVLVGANQLTFKNGQSVTSGSNNQVILGTTAYFGGTPDALTSLTVSVYAPDTSHDWIGKGNTFVDPVFGSFAITNSGLNVETTSTSRDTIKVITAGATTLDLSMKDKNGNAATFDFATNKSVWNLSTQNGYSIYPYEMANLSINSYTLTGTGNNNQYVGHLLQLQSVYNDTSTYTNDKATFYDQITGQTLTTTTPTSEGTTSLIIDGRTYGVTYWGAAGSSTSAGAAIKFPSSDSPLTTTYVLYPTILANGGESVMLYKNMTLNLGTFNGTAGGTPSVSSFYLPNGNGLTQVTVSETTTGGMNTTWLINGNAVSTNATDGSNFTTVTVGKLVWNFTSSGVNNVTRIYLDYPTTGAQSGGATINEPAVVVFDGKDTSNNYNAVIIDTTQSPIGTSTSGVGVNGIYYTSTSGYGNATTGVQFYSNSNLASWVDGYGTLVTKDSTNSGQPIATLLYPPQQVYEQLYLGASSATVAGGNLGNVLVTDSQVSTVSSKNLVVVGGSCINSAAAALVGGAYCGSAWTAATGIGSGQFLIKGYTSGIAGNSFALLVAGYEAADTTNAANYLTHYTVDTSKAYSGTSGTTANLIVS
ncbi:MAG: hypothetical protein ABSG05_01555 [Candidatus Pacearchaeota archaeon]